MKPEPSLDNIVKPDPLIHDATESILLTSGKSSRLLLKKVLNKDQSKDLQFLVLCVIKLVSLITHIQSCDYLQLGECVYYYKVNCIRYGKVWTFEVKW